MASTPTAGPCAAHMFATGELLGPADPVIGALVAEARQWLASGAPALAALDPVAAGHVRAWSTAGGPAALAEVEALARHVLGADTFFDWSSPREPVAIDSIEGAPPP